MQIFTISRSIPMIIIIRDPIKPTPLSTTNTCYMITFTIFSCSAFTIITPSWMIIFIFFKIFEKYFPTRKKHEKNGKKVLTNRNSSANIVIGIITDKENADEKNTSARRNPCIPTLKASSLQCGGDIRRRKIGDS